MSWDFDGTRETKEEVAERIAREISVRRERGEPFTQVLVESKKGMPAQSFWGKAWCENLESYKDYEFRLPRGRSYLRNGNVYDLTVVEGEVFAYVTGAEIYEVLVRVEVLEEERWEDLKRGLAGEIGNVVDLLGGKLGGGVMAAVTGRERGLFPSPAEIRFDCTCPDEADLCKHVAATLYAAGVDFDETPEELFKLRGVDHRELVSAAVEGAGRLGEIAGGGGGNVLEPGELSELFGIEITDPESAF